MEYEKHLKKVDEYLKEVDRISALGHGGWNDRIRLDEKVTNFIRITFADYELKLQDYKDGKDRARVHKRDGKGYRVLDKQKTQAQILRRIKWYLEVLKDEFELKNQTKTEDSKLVKLKEAVEEKEVESERREKVTETKFYGAAIEIIDRLREELKSREQFSTEIRVIKSDINEIKDILKKLHEKSDNK